MEKHHLSTSLFVLTIFFSTILFQFHPIWMNDIFNQISVSPKVIAYFVLIAGIIGLILFGMSFKIQPENKMEREQETELDPDYETEETLIFFKFNTILSLKVILTSIVLTTLTYFFLDQSLHYWCKDGTSMFLTFILLFGNGVSSIILGYRIFLLLQFRSISKARGIEVLAGQFKSNPTRIRDKESGYGYTGGDTRSINRRS